MQRNRQPSDTPMDPCGLYIAGNCTQENCRFYHDSDDGAASNATLGQQGNRHRRNAPRGARARHHPVNARSGATGDGTKRCSNFSRGNCIRGEDCRFIHDMELSPGSPRIYVPFTDEPGSSSALKSTPGPSSQPIRRVRTTAKRAVNEALRTRIAQEEAAHTFTTVMGGSIVTFGAGAAIQSFVPGFDTSNVKITGLPINATLGSISILINVQDIPPNCFWITSHHRDRRDCEVLVDCKYADQLVSALDDAEINECLLRATVADGGAALIDNSNYMLSIWWRAPAVSYVATYGSIATAQAQAHALNGQILHDRRVHVFVQNVRNAALDVLPSSSIIVDSLPSSATTEEIASFTGTAAVVRQSLKDYDVDTALIFLRYHIMQRALGNPATATRPNERMVKVRVPFDDGDVAARVRKSLEGQRRFSWNGNWPMYTRLDEPMRYKLSIPIRQYDIQKRQWDELASSGTGASLKIDVPRFLDRPHIFIQILGREKEAMGQLRVRAEDLARGVDLGAWFTCLTEQYLDVVAERTQTFLLRDTQTCRLKVFGAPAAILRAREEIKAEEDRLAQQAVSFPIDAALVSYFLRQGILSLKEELGKENARMRGPRARCSIVVHGGEAARCAVQRHMVEAMTYRPSATAGAICPVCFMEPSAPFRLGCGHVYCTTCAKHLLSSATENKIFPLFCIGEDATCRVPIPIPTIRKFLTEDAVTKLSDAAFATHMERNANQLKYCRTAACGQVYNTSGDRRFLTCPSCFATVCTGCNEGAHVGWTCEENTPDVRRKHDEELNDALIAEQNYKRCPNCRVLVEKTEGCNHMQCSGCQTHFCWRCTQAFPTGQAVYTHMSEAHGGMYGEDPTPAPFGRALPAQADQLRSFPDNDFGFGHYDAAEQLRMWQAIEATRRARRRNFGLIRAQALHSPQAVQLDIDNFEEEQSLYSLTYFTLV